MTRVAKVFRNGASQAVRLPREFRFDAEEVCIKRIGPAILLFPKDVAWDMMGEVLGQVDEDFMVAREQPANAETRTPL